MFRENLKEMIEYRGLLIKELSAKTGISKRTLDTYVDSRAVVPSAEAAVKLAEALGTTVEYLVTGKEGKRKKIDIPPSPDTQLFRKYRKIVDEIERLPPDLQKVVFAMIHRAAEVSKTD